MGKRRGKGETRQGSRRAVWTVLLRVTHQKGVLEGLLRCESLVRQITKERVYQVHKRTPPVLLRLQLSALRWWGGWGVGCKK